ncbi:MAG TPA: FHA domain-containing protein [Pyrinomonadaceae bacterium]|nr:FHA domain-containing protein [Pyrinomonadaceae bacterium]
MNLALLALALLQADADSSRMWIIIIAVLVVLFLIVVAVAIGLAVFFVMRKRKKAQLIAGPGPAVVSDASYTPAIQEPTPEPAPAFEAPAAQYEASPAQYDTAEQETNWPATADVPPPAPVEEEVTDFDPSRTVAIVREPTVEISYGQIKFVSGVLAGEEFAVNPAGAYIGREPSLSQIVVSDPRISKRHLWVGVRDGAVTIVDQESRNGTFVNDPRSERVHEAKLNPGDVVIMGESDVARFEYHG